MILVNVISDATGSTFYDTPNLDKLAKEGSVHGWIRSLPAHLLEPAFRQANIRSELESRIIETPLKPDQWKRNTLLPTCTLQ